jgi:hypothetical protein
MDPTFSLIDDGTMDTVLTCSLCGGDERIDGETAADYREESGELTEAGLRSLVDDLGLVDSHECKCDEPTCSCRCSDPIHTMTMAAWERAGEPSCRQCVSVCDARHEAAETEPCNQCEVLVINGILCHETGCPNMTRECKGCNARISARHRYCDDCNAS